MKKLKRMFALTLMLCMVLTYVMPVYADGVQNDTLVANAHESVVYYEYDPEMKELFRNEAYDYTLVDSSYTSLTLDLGHWYVIDGEVTLQSRVENKSQLSSPANIILTNGCTLNVLGGIENGSRNSLRIYGQDKNGGTGQLNIKDVPENCAGIGGGYSPGLDTQGCGYVEINGGVLEIHGGKYGAGIGGGGDAADVSVTINAGKVTAYGGNNGAGIGTGIGTTSQILGNGKITINGGTVEAFGGNWGAGIGCGYHGYPNAVEINGGNVTAIGGSRGAAGIGGGKDTDGVDTKISGGTVCAIGNVDISYDAIGCGIGCGTKGYNHRSLTISGEQVSILSGTDDTDATVTAADSYVRLREPYVLLSSTKYPVYTVKWMLDDGKIFDTTYVTEGKMPVHSDPVKDSCIFTGWTPALAPVTGDITYTARFYELAHEHSFSETWSTNETHHWHEAACDHTDLVSGFGEHTFDENGKCTVCGYEKKTDALTEAKTAAKAEIDKLIIAADDDVKAIGTAAKTEIDKLTSITAVTEKLTEAIAKINSKQTEKAIAAATKELEELDVISSKAKSIKKSVKPVLAAASSPAEVNAILTQTLAGISEAEEKVTDTDKYLVNRLKPEVGAMMGRQSKISDSTKGRVIIPVTEKQLKEIGDKLVIVGGDFEKETTIEIDCAYTYFYNGETKIEAKDVTVNANGDKAYAFIIIDCDANNNPISGYGYYRLYNNSVSTDNFLFDVIYADPAGYDN